MTVFLGAFLGVFGGGGGASTLGGLEMFGGGGGAFAILTGAVFTGLDGAFIGGGVTIFRGGKAFLATLLGRFRAVGFFLVAFLLAAFLVMTRGGAFAFVCRGGVAFAGLARFAVTLRRRLADFLAFAPGLRKVIRGREGNCNPVALDDGFNFSCGARAERRVDDGSFSRRAGLRVRARLWTWPPLRVVEAMRLRAPGGSGLSTTASFGLSRAPGKSSRGVRGAGAADLPPPSITLKSTSMPGLPLPPTVNCWA